MPTRFLPPVTSRFADAQLDAVLRNLDQRIRELADVLTGENPDPIVQLIINNITIRQSLGALPLAFVAATTGTAGNADWWLHPAGVAGTGAADTSFVNSEAYSVPPGYNRVIGMSLFVRVAGVPGAGSPNLNYIVQRGNTAAQVQDILTLALPTTFVGATTLSGDATVAPGDQLRVTQRRTNSITTSPTDMIVVVLLQP